MDWVKIHPFTTLQFLWFSRITSPVCVSGLINKGPGATLIMIFQEHYQHCDIRSKPVSCFVALTAYTNNVTTYLSILIISF